MIECQRLVRNYDEFRAVDSVSFSVSRGEIVGLLGHNGAGKTTIMKMMTGYLEPSEGRILLDGEDTLDERSKLQSRLGYLPENCPVYPEMSVVAYLDYVASLRNIEGTDRVLAVNNAMERTGLTGRANQIIGTLSRGFRQRVGVAQAILHKPDFVVLDEPTNGLDPSQIEEMRRLVRELGQNSTVILSTHILQEVEAICDRVLIILKGQLALDAQIEDLKRSERIVLRAACDTSRLESILSNIHEVQPQSVELISNDEAYTEMCFQLRVPGQATSSEVLSTLINKGILVHHYATEERSLQTVFKEINRGTV